MRESEKKNRRRLIIEQLILLALRCMLVILALWPLGYGKEGEPTARWWLERPVWIIVPGLVLVGLVALFGRFEAQGRRR